jgi:NADH:ubiquinone oxidoreductase subunit F (NADH-binding)/(2Fe-2S) ferredoxin/ferredoxin
MDFKTIKNNAHTAWEDLINNKNPVLYFGAASCGLAAGILDVKIAAKEALEKMNINAELVDVGCFGPCYLEPLVYIQKPGSKPICYSNMTPEKIGDLINSYLLENDMKSDLSIGVLGDEGVENIPPLFEHPDMKKQKRVVMKNCGLIDPTNINHYIAHNGYSALNKVIKMAPEKVIEEVSESGLRGRGGAGFPAGRKWDSCRKSPGEPKYIVCNADEGDPGAFMDRSILEGDPHAVIEGMIIAAYAIGATKGYIYVRAEYPLAVEHLIKGVKDAKDLELLGDNILGTDFCFDIEIFQGAGAFVCGESTALVLSIEGKRGMPKPVPRPRTTQKGINDKPTLLNNVKTYAYVPQIINNGAKWFAKIGTSKSTGTAVFALTGKIEKGGLVEVAMGTPLREIIFDIGGGIPNDKEFKAVQTGGPSGGCIPEKYLDTPVDFDELDKIGSIMGSGGMVIMDEDTCMVDVARFFINFTKEESCGKCTPCREGTQVMLEMLNRITEGDGVADDIDTLKDLGEVIIDTSICGLGQSAPNPVLTTIQYFKDEYLAHVQDRKCPGKVCKPLFHYEIDQETCIGCVLCRKKCPVDAISGEKKEPHSIDNDICIKCGICYSVCPKKVQAVQKVDSFTTSGGGA